MKQRLVRALGLAAGFALLVLVACSGSSGQENSSVCNFPTVLEQTPDGGDQLLLCGDGSILECSEGSCAFANGSAQSGSPNSGNTSDSGNPTDSNNRTTVNNPAPTPTPRGLGR